MKRSLIVAIDGPAGSGKSTVARLLASRLGFTHIDTGALYRGVALLALEKKVDLDKEQGVLGAVGQVKFEFRVVNSANTLHLNGRNVGQEIRTEAVGAAASKVSALPGVRHLLLSLQREMGSRGSVVLEGRDIGTVVFPKADLKVFLTASLEIRAQRRQEELQKTGIPVSSEKVKLEMAQRDKQDSERKIAPLQRASDAVLLDTSALTIESVLDRLESLVKDVT